MITVTSSLCAISVGFARYHKQDPAARAGAVPSVPHPGFLSPRYRPLGGELLARAAGGETLTALCQKPAPQILWQQVRQN